MRILTLSIAMMFLVVPARARARWNRTVLVANYDSQAIQNERANEYGLSRMRNAAMIQRFYRDGNLVAVPASTRFYYLHEIAPAYRYLRPWTKLFLDRLSSEYYARFGEPLRVTSLVRTVDSQLRLARFDPNAAEARGPHRSAHLTGAALDISKHSMSYQEVEWMRRTLYELKREGVIYAIEEFVEPNFHVMVYPTYSRYLARLERNSSPNEPTVTAARHVRQDDRADTSTR
jgi:hypothetical protein